jgi:hypothetical protein
VVGRDPGNRRGYAMEARQQGIVCEPEEPGAGILRFTERAQSERRASAGFDDYGAGDDLTGGVEREVIDRWKVTREERCERLGITRPGTGEEVSIGGCVHGR